MEVTSWHLSQIRTSRTQTLTCPPVITVVFLLTRPLCALWQTADAFPVRRAEPSHFAPPKPLSSPSPPPVSMVGFHSNFSLCSAHVTSRSLASPQSDLASDTISVAVSTTLLFTHSADKSVPLSPFYTWTVWMDAQHDVKNTNPRCVSRLQTQCSVGYILSADWHCLLAFKNSRYK